MNYFRNLKSEWIEIPKEGYYNLESGRIIKKKENYKQFTFDDHYHVCGTSEHIRSFHSLNQKQSTPSFDCFKNYNIQNTWDLNGIMTTCKVIQVIDGDTYDIDVYLDFEMLKQCCTVQKGSGIFRFRCRLYGIDTKEKNTSEGQYTIQYCKNRIKENDLFYCQCFGNDKYGRLMVRLYSKQNQCFNDELLCLKTPEGQECCKPYFGGHKD